MARAWTPEKPLHWVSSSKKDLLRFPHDVVHAFGYALGLVQAGGTPPGVFELVKDGPGGSWRTVYAVRFEEAVYVLHCFHKKSPSGIRTAQTDVELVRARLKMARDDYKVRYGQKT